MTEQLFEWETKPPKQKSLAEKPRMIDRPRAYMAIATAKQGPTFHRVRYVERDHGTYHTWCGLLGHQVSNPAKRVPECAACEAEYGKQGVSVVDGADGLTPDMLRRRKDWESLVICSFCERPLITDAGRIHYRDGFACCFPECAEP